MMADDKNEMLEDNIGFKKTLGDKIENFINVTSKELKDEAFRLQNSIQDRVDAFEIAVKKQDDMLLDHSRDLKLMQAKIGEEYLEFCKNRKNLKSEFSLIHDKMFKKIHESSDKIEDCVEQNEVNTNAIKMILDAQMIEHLMQRQDVEDRKNIVLTALEKEGD